MFNKKLKKDYEDLKNRVRLFEMLTSIPIDNWLISLGKLEHLYHSKLDELNKKEAVLAAKEQVMEQRVVLAKAEARAEYEEKYNHELHEHATKFADKLVEVVKAASTLERVIVVNGKDIERNK